MKISILLYDGFTALDAVGPYEVLSRIPGASVTFVGKERGPIRTDTGMLSLSADKTLEEVTQTDILLVPGGLAGTYSAAKDEAILNWVRPIHQTTRWTTSVCTGAIILGAAGILDGLRATSHWYARKQLDQYGATYVPERFVEEGKIVTAAGVSAGIDMALWLSGKLLGRQLAQAIQLGIEYDPQPPHESGSWKKASIATKALAESVLHLQVTAGTVAGKLDQR